MAMKLMILLALLSIAAAAPRSRNFFYDYLFRRASIGGCSQEEIDALIESGVDVGQSSIECGNDARDPGAANSVNDPIQSDEMDQQKRGCSIDYSANPACCSPGCDWIMELHCMSPVMMICKK